MFGSAFILHKNGWSCSNDVTFEVEKDIIEVEGQKVSKQTNTLKLKGIFNGVGSLSEGDNVECVFKIEDSIKKQGFVGTVKAITKKTISILLKAKTDNTQEILNKIKEEK